MTTPSGFKRLADMTEDELRMLISRVIVEELDKTYPSEAKLRTTIRSIVLEELVHAVGGESYVGNLHGFELGQPVELNAQGRRMFPEDQDLHGVIVAGLKGDNDEGYLTVQRSKDSQVLVPWDCLQTAKSNKRKG